MAVWTKREMARASKSPGRKRTIRRNRARNEDLRVFRAMRELSIKATRRYIDGLIGAA